MDPFAQVPTRQQFLEELADREAIRDCLWRYCRGIDRCDTDLLHSAFWPDALDSHAVKGKAPLNAYYWITKVIPLLDEMRTSCHTVSNVLIRIKGDRAICESHFLAIHQEHRNNRMEDVSARGRYCDKMERRDGEWRIAHRHVLVDWFQLGEESCDWEKGIFGKPMDEGDRHGRDYSNTFYAEFASA